MLWIVWNPETVVISPECFSFFDLNHGLDCENCSSDLLVMVVVGLLCGSVDRAELCGLSLGVFRVVVYPVLLSLPPSLCLVDGW